MSNDPNIIKKHECPNLPKDQDPNRYEISYRKPWMLRPFEHWGISDNLEYCGLSPIYYCPFCGVKLE